MILRDYFGLPGWATNAITRFPSKRETKRLQEVHAEEKKLM
jgi:hypothetical protein